MSAVRSVAKTEVNEAQGFRYRGIDGVLSAVGPALREHGVVVLPSKIREHSATEYTTGKYNTRMVNRVVHVEWEIRGPQGDTMYGQSFGESADSGDKSMSKAQSVALRQFLIAALAIPTGERDSDADSHERTSPAMEVGQRAPRPQETATQRRPEPSPEVAAALKELVAKTSPYGWDSRKLFQRFTSDYDADIRETDPATIGTFGQMLVDEAKAQEEKPKMDERRALVEERMKQAGVKPAKADDEEAMLQEVVEAEIVETAIQEPDDD